MLKKIDLVNESLIEKIRKNDKSIIPPGLVGKKCGDMKLTGLSQSGG